MTDVILGKSENFRKTASIGLKLTLKWINQVTSIPNIFMIQIINVVSKTITILKYMEEIYFTN